MPYHDLLEALLGQPLFLNETGETDGTVWSIRNHLKVLFNSKQGTIAHLPDYGLPDVSVIYKDFPGSLDGMRKAIAHAISKYEPRLENVSVILVDREDQIFHATYLVSASLVKSSGEGDIKFHTRITSDGRMEIV